MTRVYAAILTIMFSAVIMSPVCENHREVVMKTCCSNKGKCQDAGNRKGSTKSCACNPLINCSQVSLLLTYHGAPIYLPLYLSKPTHFYDNNYSSRFLNAIWHPPDQVADQHNDSTV